MFLIQAARYLMNGESLHFSQVGDTQYYTPRALKPWQFNFHCQVGSEFLEAGYKPWLANHGGRLAR